MLPHITLFSREISMYGAAIVVGILAALVYFAPYKKSRPALAGDIEMASVWGLLGMAVGSKLLYLLLNVREFASELPCLFTQTGAFLQKYLLGGFVFYGGIFGYLAAVALYARKEKLPYASLENVMLPGAALFHGFGRIGCFLAGCCYGCPTDKWFGVTFSHSEIAPNGVALVPVQLMEAAAEFLLFALLANTRRQYRSKTGLWLLCYGVLRFVLEFFRGDDYRGILWGLSLSQYLSVLSGALGIYLLTKRKNT